MAHEVKFNVPVRPLGNADIEFLVADGDGKMGELRVSKGGVVWVPKDHRYGFKLSWRQVAELAENHGEEGHQ